VLKISVIFVTPSVKSISAKLSLLKPRTLFPKRKNSLLPINSLEERLEAIFFTVSGRFVSSSILIELELSIKIRLTGSSVIFFVKDITGSKKTITIVSNARVLKITSRNFLGLLMSGIVNL